MYQVIYQYGDTGKYFSVKEAVEKELKQYIRIEPFIDYISESCPELILDILNNNVIKLEKDVWDQKINDLMVFSMINYDNVCLCTKERYEHDRITMLNAAADAFNGLCAIKKVEKLTIAVVDSDHEPLENMYKCGGLTLWHDVEEFIEDTDYFIYEECHEECTISTYQEAVKVWEDRDFEVISNYSVSSDKKV